MEVLRELGLFSFKGMNVNCSLQLQTTKKLLSEVQNKKNKSK